MTNKYIKVTDPTHQYFGHTFLIFFEGPEYTHARGEGININLQKSQYEETTKENYIGGKAMDNLENKLNEIKVEKKAESAPIEQPAAEPISVVIDPRKEPLLKALAKAQAEIARMYYIVLMPQALVGMVKIYFEAMNEVFPCKGMVNDMTEQQEIVK